MSFESETLHPSHGPFTPSPSPSNSILLLDSELDTQGSSMSQHISGRPSFLKLNSQSTVIFVRVSIAALKQHDRKQLGEESELASACSPASEPITRGRNSRHGRKLEAGTEAEAKEEPCLLA